MNGTGLNRQTSLTAVTWPKAALLTLPVFALCSLLLLGQLQGQKQPDPMLALAVLISIALFTVVFFLMIRTGRTDRYRAFLFAAMAVCFVIGFIPSLVELRGSNVLTAANAIDGETPFCHLVIPMLLIPAALTRTVIFPGSLVEGAYTIMSMIVIWLGASLALGRGWCSWVCFYGGLDEGFSRLGKKPLLKKLDRRWTYLPMAVLLGVVLLSAMTLSPVYCDWLCPFKAVTEYAAVTSWLALIQTVIFLALFIGLVIVLPFLTKRRTQCGLFCPLGPLQALTNKLNIFEVRVDREKCKDCGVCVDKCPTFSLDVKSVKAGRTLFSCTKCAKCVDACPQGAVYFHIKGTKLGLKMERARLLFLYPAYLFLAALGGGMIAAAIWRLLKLISTGSMI